ncbi:CoA ester lyase [Nocardioides carbamazepini]|uniref:HpcH/HpaI aldolase/citrate lyase family protein n=1 Tax=Nocardioides carbamazepini TaxID=2854259 RepID=UPI00214A617C|nr:CoA ester lyase [Nocardioides carbamazepini]MCR1783756.1 CoA ester lyase [Nocardioides carbamazepini]
MVVTSRAPARSLLYVPGDRPEWVAKAGRTAADALILDLEDAVAAVNKDAARTAVGEVLRAAEAEDPAASDGPELWVRINASSVDDDLVAVVGAALHTVLVPKAEPELLASVAARLDRLEAERSLAAGGIGVVGLLETAHGVDQVAAVAAMPRVRRLSVGEADLAAELGLVPGPDRAELAPIRSRLVVASAVAGLERPIGPVHTVLDDHEGLVTTCRQQYRQGFRGRTAIHPAQVDTINAEFLPTPAEIDRARTLVASFDASETAGLSAFAGADGHLVDPATVRRAREIVAAADAGGDAVTRGAGG